MTKAILRQALDALRTSGTSPHQTDQMLRESAARAAPVPVGRKVTTTRIANHLKKSPLGDISMYRDGFFDGAKWAAKEAT